MSYRITFSDYAGNVPVSAPTPTPPPDGSGYRIAYSDYANNASGPDTGASAGVASFNTRTGIVALNHADVIAVLPEIADLTARIEAIEPFFIRSD